MSAVDTQEEMTWTPQSRRPCLLTTMRSGFRMKPIEELPKPAFSRQRFAGLIVLRGYLLIAFTLTVVKIAQTAVK
jgi:hypothetical protein